MGLVAGFKFQVSTLNFLTELASLTLQELSTLRLSSAEAAVVAAAETLFYEGVKSWA